MPSSIKTNAEMQAILASGGAIVYRGQVLSGAKDVVDLPSDAQIAADVASGALAKTAPNRGRDKGGTWPS
jgi:hypothetical protein